MKNTPSIGSIAEAASKGGLARKAALTPEERQAIARHAVEARWEKAGKVPIAKATHEGDLKANQEHIDEKAMIIIRALASTGIIALVDEATGYQYDRPRRDLQEYLKKFLAESLIRYTSAFPNDYFKHLCRLKGVELRSD